MEGFRELMELKDQIRDVHKEIDTSRKKGETDAASYLFSKLQGLVVKISELEIKVFPDFNSPLADFYLTL